MHFNIGDIIIGNEKNDYAYTNNRAICKVVDYVKASFESREDDIKVEVLYDLDTGKCGCGTIFGVESKYFNLVSAAPVKEKKEMTIAEIEKELGYSIKVVK